MSSPQPDVAVLIGRFQPFHNAHLVLLQRALEVAPRCVVVIGSAHQARSPKNPFTWTERAEMIRLTLPEADRARVSFLAVRDHYDEARWVQAVREGVAGLLQGTRSANMALVGHFKDATSQYLRGFPGWALISVERLPGADGTHLRDALFGAAPADIDAMLGSLVDQAPPSTLAFLRAWTALPFAADLTTEWQMLRDYRAAWRTAPYPPVFVTVDAIVRCADRVLLIRRGKAPGRGLYAVPGGFIEQRETAYQSALRELEEETHLNLLADTMRQCLREVAVFDHPDRSLRGRTITHAHYFDLGERELPEVRADDDAESVEWVPIEQLPALEDRFHDDHFHMLDHFLGLTESRREP
ncbi:bifunctional nicotinamide-nucleotide adenylyltransferase/Nudix hydroxylase [Ideonella sp. YS5]|uniref:bifunctional nicotinamide-nucleotide adenylyltransferase/Nudix hydroxylase n=1 Tax=Ideonella sp. YS5 TaxID=3453714 RepID=UPI003EE8E017